MMKPFSKIKGDFAEVLACFLLKLKGYRILSRNFKGKFAEVDLLCLFKSTLIVVEVKYRKLNESGQTAVHQAQKQRLIRQLKALWAQYPEVESLRIDYVILSKDYPWIKHYKNAVNFDEY